MNQNVPNILEIGTVLNNKEGKRNPLHNPLPPFISTSISLQTLFQSLVNDVCTCDVHLYPGCLEEYCQHFLHIFSCYHPTLPNSEHQHPPCFIRILWFYLGPFLLPLSLPHITLKRTDNLSSPDPHCT